MIQQIKLFFLAFLASVGLMSNSTPTTIRKNIPAPKIKLTVTKAMPTLTPTLTPTPTVKIILAPWQVKSANFDCTRDISSMRQDERVVCGKAELNYRSWIVCTDPPKQRAIYDEIYSKYSITEKQLMDQLGQMDQANSEGNILVMQVAAGVRAQCLKSLGLKP